MTDAPDRRRARTEQQKDARRASLVAAGRSALTRQVFEEVKIAEVAAAAGVAKGTAYLYFSSKEALFLAVLEAEFDGWLPKLDPLLNQGAAVSTVAEGFARTLAANPLLLKLLGQLHVRLEAQAAPEEIRAFKLFLAERVSAYAARLETALDLEAGSGQRFLLSAHALAVGLAQVCQPPEKVRAVLEAEPAFAAMMRDFESEYAAGLKALLSASLKASPS